LKKNKQATYEKDTANNFPPEKNNSSQAVRPQGDRFGLLEGWGVAEKKPPTVARTTIHAGAKRERREARRKVVRKMEGTTGIIPHQARTQHGGINIMKQEKATDRKTWKVT